MPYEANKFYWTSKDLYARIYWVGPSEIHGAVFCNGEWYQAAWDTDDGALLETETGASYFGDLLEEAPSPGDWRPVDLAKDQRRCRARFSDTPDANSMVNESVLAEFHLFVNCPPVFITVNGHEYEYCEVWDETILPKRVNPQEVAAVPVEQPEEYDQPF